MSLIILNLHSTNVSHKTVAFLSENEAKNNFVDINMHRFVVSLLKTHYSIFDHKQFHGSEKLLHTSVRNET
jgi:hypothetical protein